MEYTSEIFNVIMESALACPQIMCEVFSKLKDLATETFLENPGMRYVVISSFIFLRFFAPAILGPKLFDLSSEQIVSHLFIFCLLNKIKLFYLSCTFHI